MILEDYDPLIHNVSKDTLTKILILGSTGSGKSSLCNSLCADNKSETFLESEKLNSFTSHTISKKVQWFDKKGDFILIDTPGMNDSESNDTSHISYLVDHLKDSVKTINSFVLVFNGANPRLDEPMKAMLKGFAEMFSLDFLKQTIIVFTRWPFDEKEKLRRKQNNDSEEAKTIQINEKIGELLKFDTEINPIKCYFLCNSYNRPEVIKHSTKDELVEFYHVLKRIKKTVLTFPIYYCDQIKKIMSEKDHLNKKLEEQIKKNHLHKIARGGCTKCDCLEYVYSSEEFKKHSACMIAATTSGGGVLGGIAGVVAGVGLGSLFSGAYYFSYNICYCAHEKKDHYNPKDESLYKQEMTFK